LIAQAVEPRVMRILPRGNWMDDSGEIVHPGIPGLFPQLRKEGRATRLDLARWIVAPENPLTARVFTNRLWKLFFGVGLTKNLDDFGKQGEAPAHPELLDWLADEFVKSGWNIKHMVRLMVTSRTYRQSSVARPDLVVRDPYNRLYARRRSAAGACGPTSRAATSPPSTSPAGNGLTTKAKTSTAAASTPTGSGRSSTRV
jgi:hypothetical protein